MVATLILLPLCVFLALAPAKWMQQVGLPAAPQCCTVVHVVHVPVKWCAAVCDMPSALLGKWWSIQVVVSFESHCFWQSPADSVGQGAPHKGNQCHFC